MSLKRRLLAFIACAAVAFNVLPKQASADIATVSLPFTVSSPGLLTNGPLNLSGQSSCAVSFSAVGSAASITVVGSNDPANPNVNTVTGIGTSGVITNPNTTTVTGGSIAPNALKSINLNFTSITGTYTGVLTCSAAVIPGSGGGGGGSYTAPPVQVVAPQASQTPFLVAPGPNNSPFNVAPAPSVTFNVHSVDPTPSPVPTNSDGGILVHQQNFPATQPVSIATTVPVSIASPFTGNLVAPYSMTTQSQTGITGSAIGSVCTYFSSPSALSSGAVAPCNVDQFDNQMVDVAAFIASLPTGTNSIGTVGLNTGTNNIGSVAAKKAQAVETTALLAANAAYTGAWHDTGSGEGTTTVNAAAYSSIGGSLANGFQIQETNDSSGLTGYYTVVSNGVTAAVYTRIVAQITARYWRITYTNNTTAQTGTFEIAYTTTSGVAPTSVLDQYGTARVGLYSSAGSAANVVQNNTDAAGIQYGLNTNSTLYGYNGTSLDRIRTSQGIQGTGVGRLATSICDPTNAYCANVNSTGTQSVSNCSTSSATTCGTVQGLTNSIPTTANSLITSAVGASWNAASSTYQYNVADSKANATVNETIPLMNPGGGYATTITSSSPTACTAIETNSAGRLVSLINAATTAQTVTLSIYNEGSSPTCSSADLIYSVVLAASDNRVLNIPVTFGLAYQLSAAATNNIIITRNYHDLLKAVGFRNVRQVMNDFANHPGLCAKTLSGVSMCNGFAIAK